MPTPKELESATNEFYGDEQQRLEDLRELDYPAFKQHLIKLHNSSPGIEVETDFVSTQNRTLGGNIFPRPEDKDALLAYTLEQAEQQDDIQDAAMILNVGVVFTHPFSDGNGRTARALYGEVSRGFTYNDNGDVESSLLRAEGVGRSFVNFGDAMHNGCGVWIDRGVYREAGFDKIARSAWYLSEDEEAAQNHYGKREYHGLTEAEVSELDRLLGEKYGIDGDQPGRYSANVDAVVYGLSRLEAEEGGLDLPISDGGTRINTPDSLALLNGEQKKLLIQYIKEYNTLYAKAAIDLISKYGNEKVRGKDGIKITRKSYVIGITNSYVASRIGGPVLGRLQESSG
jgi:hypothetical protein